ncbi:hypothetical protein V501_02797 [Pseudogymnoascus sp. VKM F-4519 (FW-2642)]|nr:hypothetical protein V501_02797 [Pseudogymnoascus sp. VKM F-4519 (FW-2642)]
MILETPEALVSAIFFKTEGKQLPMALPGRIVDHPNNAFHPNFNVGGPLESVVEKNWGKVFGDETGELSPSVTIYTSWFELRGDLT